MNGIIYENYKLKKTMYERSKIYKIISPSNPELVYYGATCNELYKRFGQHKSTSNKTNSKLIVCHEDACIVLVENFPCKDRNELRAKEHEYINNNTCVNKSGKEKTPEELVQMKERNRRYALKYYHKHNPSVVPRNTNEIPEDKMEKVLRKREYFRNYYKQHKEKLLLKANEWNKSNNSIFV
jgi:hypothetical protein